MKLKQQNLFSSINDDGAEIEYILGRLALKHSRGPAAAKKHFKKALRLCPDDKAYQKALSTLQPGGSP